jgi:hypothetical protein
MESGGNEKRIQAFFSELSLEDQISVPQFGQLWSRAQEIKTTRVRGFGGPFAVMISIFVTVAACSLAVWSWYRLSASPAPKIVVHLPQVTPVAALNTSVKLVPVSQPEKVQPQRQKNIARRRQVDHTITTQAVLLSSWQSPTQSFMASPTGIDLTSLPQLNQSVKDLESFLPKNNEIMKESNR